MGFDWLAGNGRSVEHSAQRRSTVLHHSKERDEVYGRALSLRPSRSAVIYTGAIPEDTAIVL